MLLDGFTLYVVRKILAGPLLKYSEIKYKYFNDIKPSNHKDYQFEKKNKNYFPIDIVYTWVDNCDKKWIADKNLYLSESSKQSDITHKSICESRFHSRDELKYSLRSICDHTDFVNNIYIVTSGHIPNWLNTSHNKINLIFHEEIFENTEQLPTFNSHAIESRLHHIPGLSEHFIYFNDDVFVGQYCPPSYYFSNTGRSILRIGTNLNDIHRIQKCESGLNWSIKNSSKLILKHFGVFYNFKLNHGPIPLRKSVMFELEKIFKTELMRTSSNRFRSMNDVGLTTSLAHYYGLMRDKSVISKNNDNRYLKYINVGSPILLFMLSELLKYKKYKCYCLNEPLDSSIDTTKFDEAIIQFLESYYPYKSCFEI